MDGGYGNTGGAFGGDAYGAFNTNRAKFPSSGKNDEYTTPQRKAALEKAETWAKEVAERAKEQQRLKQDAKMGGGAVGGNGRKLSLGLGKRGKGYEKMADGSGVAPNSGMDAGGLEEDTGDMARMETARQEQLKADEAVSRGISATSAKDYGAPEITGDGRRKSWVKRLFK